MLRTASFILIAFAATAACGKDGPTYGGPPIALIVLAAPSGSVVVGQTLQFTSTVRDVNGDMVTNAPLQWQSSAAFIATVSQTGVVTGRAVGTARISARYGSVKDSLDITVNTDGFNVGTAGETFLPSSLTVPVGTTVYFTFTGEHDVQFAPHVPPAPPNILIMSDVTVPRTFNNRGTFPYVCEIHPGMAGEIIVQ